MSPRTGLSFRDTLVSFAPPLGAALGAWLLWGHSTTDLLYADIPRYVFDDSAQLGTSRSWSAPGTPWHCGWTLGPGAPWPYAAVGIDFSSLELPVLVNSGDELRVRWRTASGLPLRLQLGMVAPEQRDATNPTAASPRETILPGGFGWQELSISIHTLTLPTWWRELHGTSATNHDPAVRRIVHLNVLNGPQAPSWTPDTVVIERIEIRHTDPWLGPLLVGLALATGIGLLKVRRQGHRRFSPAAPFHAQEVPDSSDASAAARLDEAARLLRETSRSAAEIAVATGFADPSYFHRRFKARFGVTPGRWRDKDIQSDQADSA